MRRLARNSLFPTGTSLLNKLLDMLFAVVMLRVLEPEGVGHYALAIVLVGYFDILASFGLPTLITREVARSPGEASRYLGSALALRGAFWAVSLPMVALLLGPGGAILGVTPQVALAVWLLMAAMLPSLLSGSLTALFMARERMEVPALVTVATTLLKIALGLVALFAGYGFVGLAAVAVVVNLLTVAMLVGLYHRIFGWPGLRFDFPLGRRLVGLAYPLMLASLLNSLFFRVDTLMLSSMVGPVALGYYNAAYRVIDGLLVISPAFTLALFPALSRLAHASGDRLRDTYWLGLKVLLIVSVPMAMGVTLLAEPLMRLFAGADYLPHAPFALQVLVWFLPFSVVNGLTQYVLIALDRQRWLTLGFGLATLFNVGANLYFIPHYSYLGAAITTILSEVVLLGPFWLAIVRHPAARSGQTPLGIPFLRLVWRPLLATAVMAVLVLLVRDLGWLLAVPLGALTYVLVMLALRALGPLELDLLEHLLGSRLTTLLRRISGSPGFVPGT